MKTIAFMNKRAWLSVVFLYLLTGSLMAMNDEISFFQGTWDQALQEATTQKKPLFIDAYATWCGPCKYMDKNVFTDANVANYFNEKFISYKLDVDQEGEIAQKYEITAMPTYLFLDASGEVIYRQTGAMGAEDFMEMAQTAYELPELDKRYKAGERDPEFIVKYLLVNKESDNEELQAVADEYFENASEEALLTENGLKLMTYYVTDPDSKAFQFYLKNYNQYTEKFGDLAAEVAYNITYAYLEDNIRLAVENSDASYIEKFEQFILKLNPAIPTPQAEEIVSLTYIQFYQMMENLEQDWPKYGKQVLAHFDKFGTFNQELVLNAAYNFAIYVDDQTMLEQMFNHLQTTTPGNEVNQMMFKFISAKMLTKLDRKDEALPLAKEALSLAEEQGYGTDFIMELITELEGESK